MVKIFTILIIFFFSLAFFSFRLLDVPRGLTLDEVAFGYNASLISETLRDENGRFLPIFVLSLQGRDWRQPVAQYMQVAMFKIFGRSLFNLKFVSVLAASFSAVIIFLLGLQTFGKKFALLALIIFLTTPVIMIHAHLALDNIMPVPFILLWVFGLWNFNEKRSYKYLVIAGVSLGIGFYAHKSMRSAAPVWTVLTLLYLLITQVKNWKKLSIQNYKPAIVFLIAILPFYLISPILDYKYAGAVYGTQTIGVSSVYDFVYFYISNFDPSFLFIKGDKILHHSTGKHGMFLLATLPVYIYGIYKSINTKNTFLTFLITCFFAGPLLLGFIGSVHRASRLIFLVPLFCLITAFGFWKLLATKDKALKLVLIIFSIVFVLNFYDFIKYYWFQYPDDTYHIFYSSEGINAYKELKEISESENLKPLISDSLLDTRSDSGAVEDFTRSLYFIYPNSFDENSELPENSILLTRNKDLKSGYGIKNRTKDYYLYKN